VLRMLRVEPARSESPALSILHRVFGYESFRGGQDRIIEHVIAGGDALVLMPTGGGKSLCYQIPALVRDGVGVVVSPLIALMQDQVDALRALGGPGSAPAGRVGRDRGRAGSALPCPGAAEC
jgi:superfamily II DNA helicase RecQ